MTAGRWTFTKFGREFYERNRQTFVLEVPVIVHTTARDGTAVQIEKHLATDRIDGIGRLTVPRVLEGAQKIAYLREAAEKMIEGLDFVPGKGYLVATNSDRHHFYNPEGEWRESSQIVNFGDDGVRVETILERRLFGTPFVSPDIFEPWGLHPTSLLDLDGNCVSTQLAELGQGKWTLAQVETDFDHIFQRMYANNEDSVYEGAATWRGNGAWSTSLQPSVTSPFTSFGITT
jgi:hypothetical protein